MSTLNQKAPFYVIRDVQVFKGKGRKTTDRRIEGGKFMHKVDDAGARNDPDVFIRASVADAYRMIGHLSEGAHARARNAYTDDGLEFAYVDVMDNNYVFLRLVIDDIDVAPFEMDQYGEVRSRAEINEIRRLEKRALPPHLIDAAAAEIAADVREGDEVVTPGRGKGRRGQLQQIQQGQQGQQRQQRQQQQQQQQGGGFGEWIDPAAWGRYFNGM